MHKKLLFSYKSMKKFNLKKIKFYLAIIFLINTSLEVYERHSITPILEDDINPISELYKNIKPSYMEDIISDVKTLLDSYAFSDILKNPPSPYEDLKIDISSEFDKIKIDEERPFYEFYRDIKKILSNFKDFTLDINGLEILFSNSDTTVKFTDYRFCLPFQFYLDYKTGEEVKMYIKEYSQCSNYYDEQIKEEIKKFSKISLEKINDIDAFEYIQTFGKDFYKLKNQDSYFTFILNNIHDNNLLLFPLLPEEINSINLKFSDNNDLNINFHIIKEGNIYSKKKSQQLLNHLTLNKELIEKIKYKRLNKKMFLQNINNEITWDFQSEDNNIKCRYDVKNQLNVLFIKSFDTDINVIFECAVLFYSNNDKIVMIMGQNIKGDNTFSYLFTQIFLHKLNIKFNFAMKQTALNKEHFQSYPNSFLDAKTCLPFKSWEDFIQSEPDDYGDGVKHYRTKIYNKISKQIVNWFKNTREIFQEEFKSKKSTDILILTDTVSYGASSNFLKTLQNYGGAITASYAGNPRLKYKEIGPLDASLDPCDLTVYKNDQTNLEENGFILYNLPSGETFENIEGEQIPNSFKVNEVDEKTNIYHSYDDSYYNEFIEEAKKILDKYNNDLECNKDNSNLVYENDKCTFLGDEHAHGGYKCNNQGKWGNECKKSYCDIGYYYDKTTGNCEIDGCTSAETIYINEEGERSYTISPDTTYIFKLNTDRYSYFFISSVDDIINYENLESCTKFCAIQNDFELMYVNYFHNLKEATEIKVVSKIMNINIDSYKLDSPKWSVIGYLDENIIDIFQLTEDNYIYVESYDKSAKFYYAVYDESFTINDMLNLNQKYFKESLDQLLVLRKDIIYIFYFKVELGACKIYFYNSLPNYIYLSNGEETNLYLESNKKYTLDFNENILPFIIRLNTKIDSTLEMKDKSGEIKYLSKSNKYFYPYIQPYNDIIEVTTHDTDAMIEILYSFSDDDTEIINDSVNEHIISKEVTLIEYSPKEDKKNIQIFLKSNELFSFGGYGGLSKDNYFHYSNYYYPNNYFKVLNYAIKLDDPLKDIELEQDEKYYIALIFSTTKNEQIIHVSVNYINSPIEELYENINESYINNVISNLVKIIDNYIYLDIIKNPPEPNGLDDCAHSKINLIDALNKINRNNRQFYEFYIELREILGTPRDIHLNILGDSTPNGIKFNYMTACLPFSFYVDKVGNFEPKIYIKYYPDCAVFFSEKIRQYVKEKEEQKSALETINGENPFDFIQKWGLKYRGNKSPHAHFTHIKQIIHSFPLNVYPYTPDDLKMSFKFEEDQEIFNLDYFIIIPNVQNMNQLFYSNDLNQKDFDGFFKNEMKRHEKERFETNIFKMMKKYKKTKRILQEEQSNESNDINDSSEIAWDIRTPEEKGIKCKIDKLNSINVLLLESFDLDYDKAFDTIYKCSKQFYQNDYKIVVIQNLNDGGNEELALILRQLLQVKINNRAYLAYKKSQFLREDFENSPEKYVNVETCRPFNNFDDFINGEKIDYSTEDETIIHEKSKIIDILDKNTRRKLEDIRKELCTGKLKRPTDIIIFTDSFATGAGSIFTKSFQNEGGAIVVGFNGNPKNNKQLFDGSQSPSVFYNFSNIKEVNDLKSLGFTINGITFGETYEDDYKIKKPIPREYKLDPVDEIVDIYEPYSDDKYSAFIQEAKKIFKKYNEDGYCNPSNTKLVLESDDNCYNFNDDEFAHGGYSCGDDGIWSSSCKKYYCGFGYYYSIYEDKCMTDYCTNDPYEKEIVLNDKYDSSIIINKDKNFEYIFKINTEEYIYFFQSNTPGYIHYEIGNPCSSLCILQKDLSIHKNEVHLNIFRKANEKEVIINIYSVKNFKGIFLSMLFSHNDILEDIEQLDNTFILISEVSDDYIFYFKTFDSSYKVLYTEYNEKMTISDILDINQNYFEDCSNKIIEASKGKIYIFASASEIYGKLLQIHIQQKLISNRIDIDSSFLPLALYLTKEKGEYTLNFAENIYDRMIHLLSSTKDSEIKIKNYETGKEVTLNSKNSYYSFDNIRFFTNKITIKINKGNNALIEFLFALDVTKFEIITEKELSNHRLLKSPIIKFDKNNKNKIITISLLSQTGKNFEYSYITGYSKNNYVNFPLNILPKNFGDNSYVLNIYNKDEKLEADESFYLILNINNDILVDDDYKIMVSKKDQDDKKSNSDYFKLNLWTIGLIFVAELML